MKKIKLSIQQKIFGGFFILILLFGINMLYNLITLNQNDAVIESNKQLITQNREVVDPSVDVMKEFELMVTQSKMLITNWVYLQSNVNDKKLLEAQHKTEYPKLKEELGALSLKWNDDGSKAKLDSLFTAFESLLIDEEEVMSSLASFEDYEDPIVKFTSQEKLESEIIPGIEGLIGELKKLQTQKQNEALVAENLLSTSFHDLSDSFQRLQYTSFILSALVIAVGIILALIISKSITKPINFLKEIILKLGQGILPKDSGRNFQNDEIGEMANAVEKLVNGLKSTSHFAEKIGQGTYDTDYAPLSEQDVLGNSLIEMRDNLQKVAGEDKKRNWVTGGLAKFSEILRTDNDNQEKLANNVVSNLVTYTNSNQGALYMVSDAEEHEDSYMELAACYAWDKKKFLEQKIIKSEGLIGQCWHERETIYMTDVPADFINITSGLGKANPKSILIVPLKINDQIYGMIELASFNQFEKHEIDFVERIAENIASAVSAVKINERTSVLLVEANEMTEEMRAQEEEMRQNMEELQATQEEMERTQNENESRIMNLTSSEEELKEQLLAAQHRSADYLKELEALKSAQ